MEAVCLPVYCSSNAIVEAAKVSLAVVGERRDTDRSNIVIGNIMSILGALHGSRRVQREREWCSEECGRLAGTE